MTGRKANWERFLLLCRTPGGVALLFSFSLRNGRRASHWSVARLLRKEIFVCQHLKKKKKKKNQRTIAIDLEEGRPICALYVYAPSVTLASRSFSIPRAPYCRAHTPRLAAAIVSCVVCNVAQLAGRLQKRPTGDANECGRNSFTRHQSTFSPYYATIHHLLLLLLQLLMVD